MSLFPSTDFSLLTALERELGRPRVKAMAQSYLYATMSAAAAAATGPTVHSPLSSPRMSPSRDPSQLGYTMEGLGFDLPRTPPPARPSLAPPGAPARLSRAARPVLNPEDEDEDASPLPSLVIPPPPPPSEESCPRHSRIASAGFGLLLSSSPPAGNGCSSCVRDQEKKDAIAEIWALYCEAYDDCDPEKIERGMRAIAIFHELYPEYDNMDLTNHALGKAESGFERLMREYNS